MYFYVLNITMRYCNLTDMIICQSNKIKNHKTIVWFLSLLTYFVNNFMTRAI